MPQRVLYTTLTDRFLDLIRAEFRLVFVWQIKTESLSRESFAIAEISEDNHALLFQDFWNI